MAEELFDHGGVCGGNWWNSSINLFSSSPCSSATNETGSFGWRSSHELNMDVNTSRSSENSAGSVSDGSPTILRDAQKFQQQPTADNLNQDLRLDTGRSEANYSQIVQASGALNSSMNYRHQTSGPDCNEIDNWNPSKINFSGDFSVNAFKRENQISFSLQQQSLASITECNETCQGLTTNFPLNSASYGYTSSLLRTLFDTDSDHPQQALFDNQDMSYLSPTKFSNELMSGFPQASLMEIKPSAAKQQPANRLQFSNNTPFWDATARPDFIPSTPSQFLTSGLNNFPSTSDQKRRKEESKNLASVAKKSINEPAIKHPRLETPSPLPTFKVRKEKLGDRITALQQLVSPFGKTDTASVLHEAIAYIKFLHDQVNVLSTPYLQNGSPPLQRQQDQEDLKKDLSSRGLCLVPISSTFPVAAENTSDYWTPSFGRCFR